jgi:hypothetical protein
MVARTARTPAMAMATLLSCGWLGQEGTSRYRSTNKRCCRLPGAKSIVSPLTRGLMRRVVRAGRARAKRHSILLPPLRRHRHAVGAPACVRDGRLRGEPHSSKHWPGCNVRKCRVQLRLMTASVVPSS